MAEIVLQSPCVVAIIGELEPAGVAKHVWVDREWHFGACAASFNTCRCWGVATFGSTDPRTGQSSNNGGIEFGHNFLGRC